MLGGSGVPNYDGWCICKCPSHSDEHPSLSIKDVVYGRLFHCFAGCYREEIIAAINTLYRHGGLYRSRQVKPSRIADSATGYDPMTSVRRILAESETDAALMRCFYRDHRSIMLPLPPALRFHPSLWHAESGTFGPGIVAPVCDLQGDVRGLYRLWLDPLTGGKAKLSPVRKALGPIKGNAIHLIGEPDDGEILYIAEGVENALAYVEIAGPCKQGTLVWSAVSAPGIAALIVPERVHSVIVLLDKDEAALAAVNTLSRRLEAQGHRAHVSVRTPLSDPPADPQDFNDMLLLVRPPEGAQ
jgi:hypothetical protein